MLSSPKHGLPRASTALAALVLALPGATRALDWTWSYAAQGVTASGTLTTGHAPDTAGWYEVTGISGIRNAVAITSLQNTGTSIPGNAPYEVDNRIRAADPQLTGDGLGFALADGTYVNAFFGHAPAPEGYQEFFSTPPFTDGLGLGDTEQPVHFTATPETRRGTEP